MYFDDIFEFDDVTPDSQYVRKWNCTGRCEGGDIYSNNTNKIKIAELSVSSWKWTPVRITKAAMTGSDEISDEMIAQVKPYYRSLYCCWERTNIVTVCVRYWLVCT